jgi:superfamily II DNA or RNA helicase
VKFDKFLTRADDEVLQELLTTRVVRLLRALDSQSFNLNRQRLLLLEQTRPQTLLGTTAARRSLLELLSRAEAEQLCRVLGLQVTDPFEALKSARWPADRVAALLEFFELSPLQVEKKEDTPEVRECAPAYSLFSHQERAARRVIDTLLSAKKRVLLHMPTGAGKTRTAMHIIAEWLRRSPEKSVVWLAHSEELCEQAATEFEKAWSSLGTRSVSVRRYWGARSLDVDSIQSDFVVAGLPKMNAMVKRSLALLGKLGAKTSLVVIDEAHQAIAPTYQLILDALVLPFSSSALLGLSATPGRTWNSLDADEELAAFFNRQKVPLEIEGYSNPVSYLVDEGYLARTTFRPLSYQSGVSMSETEKATLRSDLEIPPDVLQRLAEDEIRNLVILSEVEQLSKRHRRIIVFATTVEHSDLLAYTLRARGLWARSVTGSTPKAERQAALESYKASDGEAKIICNFGVLTTGFDAPETSAAVIARPTISLVLYSQMVGRAIRGKKAGGNLEAEIATVVDSGLPGFGDVGDAFLNWEDVWGE